MRMNPPNANSRQTIRLLYNIPAFLTCIFVNLQTAQNANVRCLKDADMYNLTYLTVKYTII